MGQRARAEARGCRISDGVLMTCLQMPWASSCETLSPASGVGDRPLPRWLSTALHHPALRHVPPGRASPQGSGLALSHELGNHGPVSPGGGGPSASSGPPSLCLTESWSTSDHLAFNPGISSSHLQDEGPVPNPSVARLHRRSMEMDDRPPPLRFLGRMEVCMVLRPMLAGGTDPKPRGQPASWCPLLPPALRAHSSPLDFFRSKKHPGSVFQLEGPGARPTAVSLQHVSCRLGPKP